jgi:hypothetical protein
MTFFARVDFVRRLPSERSVWPQFVVPFHVQRQTCTEFCHRAGQIPYLVGR